MTSHVPDDTASVHAVCCAVVHPGLAANPRRQSDCAAVAQSGAAPYCAARSDAHWLNFAQKAVAYRRHASSAPPPGPPSLGPASPPPLDPAAPPDPVAPPGPAAPAVPLEGPPDPTSELDDPPE